MPEKDWKEIAKRKALGILAADRLLGMAGIERARLMTARLARKTADGTLGQPTREPEDEELRTMQITVGDTYHQAMAPSKSKLAKLAVVAGLLATGAGVGALPWLLSAFLSPGAPPADTNTQYELRFEQAE